MVQVEQDPTNVKDADFSHIYLIVIMNFMVHRCYGCQ